MQIISIDTDGIYIDSEIDVNKLNKYLDDKTKEIFNLPNFLHVDKDVYNACFFRQTKGKHYILKDHDRLIFHGQSFKGSNAPRFFDDALEKIANDMFEGKQSERIDIKTFPIDSLIQSIRIKDESSYKTDSSLSMQLIAAAKREMPDIKLTDNDQLSYIKCKRGYELVMPGKKYEDIDWEYYQGIIDKIYDRLKINDSSQIRLDVLMSQASSQISMVSQSIKIKKEYRQVRLI